MQAREEKERKKDEEYAEMDKDEKVSSVSIMSTTLNHVWKLGFWYVAWT